MRIQLFLAYLLIINLIAFAIYGIDKMKAAKGRWRISESALLMLALIGGALGAWIGMFIFRHKTKHWKFIILVPLFTILWVAISLLLIGTDLGCSLGSWLL